MPDGHWLTGQWSGLPADGDPPVLATVPPVTPASRPEAGFFITDKQVRTQKAHPL